ncbi:MAG: hypothetical protein COA47_14765 [Robiginitomaculum sp.]|nr:MAG: hypothetical protein COA47_14765 [Robiginitomaculum sp.]
MYGLKGYKANDVIHITSEVTSGTIVEYEWSTNIYGLELENNHESELYLTLPMLNGYTDLSYPGREFSVTLHTTDSNGTLENESVVLRAFALQIDEGFNQKALNEGIDQDAINNLCSEAIASNLNFYNVQDMSVYCVVESGKPIVRYTSRGYSCPKNVPCSIEADLTDKIITAKSEFNYASSNYGILRVNTIFDGTNTVAIFDNTNFSYSQMKVEADKNEYIDINSWMLWTKRGLPQDIGLMTDNWY